MSKVSYVVKGDEEGLCSRWRKWLVFHSPFLIAFILSANSVASITANDEPDHSAHIEDSDPYSLDNLPEQDEETDCFLCRTNRNGPCSRYWRPLEYCVKDQHGRGEEDSNDSSACDRYIRPFEDCWSRHAALYLLISHAVTYDTLVQQVERDNPTRLVGSTDEFHPVIDWTIYEAFCRQETAREKAEQVNRQALVEPSGQVDHLWKLYNQQKLDPVVVNISAQVSVRYSLDGDADAITRGTNKDKPKRLPCHLRLAYAVDQNNDLIGFLEVTEKDEEDQEIKLIGRKLLVTILPGYTESIRIKALYIGEQRAVLMQSERVYLHDVQCP